MKKTRRILMNLDIEGRFPTKAEIKVLMDEIKSSYPKLLQSIKAQCSNRKDYAELLNGYIKDNTLQTIVSYITYLEFDKAILLSFDNMLGVYNIEKIYNPKSISFIWYYIREEATTVAEVMRLYIMAESNTTMIQLWNHAKSIATSFDDYEEMCVIVLPKTEHWMEAIELLNGSAKTEKQKNRVKELIEE